MGNVLSTLQEPDEEELAPSRTELTIRRARLADHDQGRAAEESPSKPDPEVAQGIRQRLVDGIHSFVAPHIPCPGVVKDLNYFSISALELLSLREQISLVDPRSASAVTKFVSRGLTKKDLYALINEFDQGPEDAMVTSISKEDGWEWKEEKVRVILETNPPNPKHRELIDKAREKYAALLRDIDYRDIDVLFTGADGHLGIFIYDQDRIIRAGGLLYNRFSTYYNPPSIGMSAILPKRLIDEIFPDRRLNITIRANIEPARPKVEEIQPWYGIDSILKHMHPAYVALRPNPSRRELELANKEVVDELYCRLWSEPGSQPLARAKQSNWYKQYSNKVFREPRWTKATNPVAQNVADPSDENWWKADTELKSKIITNWLERDEKIDCRSASSEAAQSSSGGLPAPFPRISNNFNNSSSQYAGMEAAISKMVMNVDDLQKRREKELVAAEDEFRKGRMNGFELDELEVMWDTHVKDAKEKLHEALN